MVDAVTGKNGEKRRLGRALGILHYCCYKINLQADGFSVHSLIEAEVAANKDWR
jgi:hypothetical protein